MALGTKERPERIASDVGAKAVKAPGAKTGASGAGQDGSGKGKGKSLKLKLIVGLLVLLLGGGAAAKFTVLAPKPANAAAAKAKAEPGPIVQLSELTLNLTGGQYLRMKMALQTVKGSKPIEDTTMATQLIIDEYSNHTPAELTGDAARQKAKAALLAKLQKAYPKQILDALYTEFVMTS
jgi:flagellar basal body-associated protein FliL